MYPQIRRIRDRRLIRVTVAILLATALGGCATASGSSYESSRPQADRAMAKSLYEGQPTAVHATQYPVTSAAEGIARGDEAWRKGQLDLATYLYVQSLAYDSTSAVPFLKIGAIHEKRGNGALAARAFELALARDPDNAGANERLGLLYLQDGRDDAAKPLFERAIALDSGRWQSHNGLGIAADRRKDYAAAIRHYDAALAVEPRATMVINNRGYSRYLAGDFAGAEAEYQRAISLGPRSGAWVNLGMAQARQRKYEQALESFLKENDEAHARNLLGVAAMEGGDLETAQSEFMLALSASPRFFQAAQDNLDLVVKRIAERDLPVPAAGASPAVASARPGEAAMAATTSGIPWSTAATSLYGAGKGKWQSGGNALAAKPAKACVGAEALKPRCNPYAARKPKPYRVASSKKPRG
jgi:Flp pilus assembly protein TadD